MFIARIIIQITSMLIISSICAPMAIADDNLSQCISDKYMSSDANSSMQTYYTEKDIVFHQILSSAYTSIHQQTKNIDQKQAPWGIVIGLDDTILNTSAFMHYKKIGCVNNNDTLTQFIEHNQLPVNPGMAEFTCSIQAMGGKIIIVTKRHIETKQLSDSQIAKATQTNLSTIGACYDSIIYAHDNNDTNKNPNFQAILTGDYENVITTKKLPALQIVAFIGNGVEDFPNMNRGSAFNYLNQHPDVMDKFGNDYFLLPNIANDNPQHSYWK